MKNIEFSTSALEMEIRELNHCIHLLQIPFSSGEDYERSIKCMQRAVILYNELIGENKSDWFKKKA